MKHLKTFESYTQLTEEIKNWLKEYEFKKYLIFEAKLQFTIFEIIKVEDNNINLELKVLYSYNKRDKEFIKNSVNQKSYSYNYSSILPNTIYQSDNLQDCIDFLKIKDDIEKYNL